MEATVGGDAFSIGRAEIVEAEKATQMDRGACANLRPVND